MNRTTKVRIGGALRFRLEGIDPPEHGQAFFEKQIASWRRLLVLALIGSAAPVSSAAPLAELPFELAGDHTFVEVTVKGRSLSFVFDTGAYGAALNSKVARRLGIDSTSSAPATGAAGSLTLSTLEGLEIEIGSLGLVAPLVYLVPLEHLEEAVGRPIDGIIGSDLLQRGVVVTDHERHVIEIYERGTFPAADWGKACSLVAGHQVEGELELHEGTRIDGRFIVDSGAAQFLVLAAPFVREHDLEKHVGPTYRAPTRALSGDGPDASIGSVKSFRFCGWEFPSSRTQAEHGLPVALSSARRGVLSSGRQAGLLGNGVLKRFDTAFDRREQQLYLRPNQYWHAPVRSDASGLSLVQSPGRAMEVFSVLRGSPADRAGIRVGDSLREIDGEKVATMTLETVRERLRRVGETPTLEFERDDRSLVVDLKLRLLGRP